MADGKYVASFKKKKAELEDATGYRYQILHPNFNAVLDSNRLYAFWFEPESIIASADAEGNTVIFDIDGEFSAEIVGPDGDVVTSFDGHLTEIVPENSGLKLLSDADIETLLSEGGMNGFRLIIEKRTSVRAYLEKDSDIFVTARHPSVARALLNKAMLEGLLAKIPADDGSDMPDPVKEDIAARKAFGEFPEDIMAASIDEDFVLPELTEEPQPYSSAGDVSSIPEAVDVLPGLDDDDDAEITEDEADAAPDADMGEVPSEDVPADVPEEEPQTPAPEEKKAPKKSSKKAASKASKKESAAVSNSDKATAEPKEKKPEPAQSKKVVQKQSASGSAPQGRFDLLPLDMIGDFIEIFDMYDQETSFLSDIEAYKKTGTGLLEAAASYARTQYSDAVDAVMDLAILAEKDAEENGENAWKERDITGFLNGAVRCYLLSLKDKGTLDYRTTVLWNLICGAAIAES